MGKSKVFYEKVKANGELQLSGGLRATKVQAAKNRKAALAKSLS